MRVPPQRSQLHLTRQARAASLRRRQTPAQYPIGWIHQHLRRLPVFGAGSSAEAKEPSPGFGSPECPADVGSGWNSAATLPPRLDPHRPCQTRDSRYHRNAEHADWSRIATRIASDDAPEKPRRASPAPATPHERPPKTSNIGVDSRRIERVSTPFAEQHVTARRRDRARPDHGSCGPKPALSVHQFRSAAST
jgi:hypothetical protein